MPFLKIVDVDGVKRVIENWLRAVLSPDPAPAKQMPIYFEWQSGTKANTKPFATYHITGPEKLAITEDVSIVAGTPTLGGNRVFHVEVNCYSDGEEAGEMATALVESFEQPQFYYIIEAGGAALIPPSNPILECSVSNVREPVDLSQLLETKWERRTMLEFDLIVSALASMDDGSPQGAGAIEKVETSGTATDAVGGQIEADVIADK